MRTKIEAIGRQDLLDHQAFLAEQGLSDRTVHNHVSRIASFLAAAGKPGLLKSGDKLSYDEREVAAYDLHELNRLFSHADAEDRLLFEFFLATGFREQEVMFYTWANLNPKAKLAKVGSKTKAKAKTGFRIKDRQERSVPVPDFLVAALVERKTRATPC